MKHAASILLAALGFAGLAGGYLIGQANRDRASAAAEDQEGSSRKSPGRTEGAAGADRLAPRAASPDRSTIRSEDSLGDLIALSDEALYGRLALWLTDATTEEIAAYWEHHKSRENRSRDITDLVMIGWTRIDPQGAIAAVAGTDDEHYAWWAWACHDPATALQTAIDTSPGRIGNVTWGIGEFHPKWLREHFDEIPEAGRGNALAGLTKWGEVDDAMATLEFLKELGHDPPQELLKNLVRQDPWAAYEWIEANGNSLERAYGSRDYSMKLLIAELADSHPEVLERLIDQQPSGERKRTMEAAAFGNLMELDLEAALAEAQSTTAPRIAADRLAQVALRLSRTDPERAFEVARRLFAEHPDALNISTRIQFGSGSSSSWSEGNSSADTLLNALVARDPERLMEITTNSQVSEADSAEVPAGGGAIGGAIIGNSVGFGVSPSGSSLTSQVASKWAAQDLNGFAEWVVEQNDPNLTSSSAPAIVAQLQQQSRFEEAAEWTLGMGENRRFSLHRLLRSWQQADPDQARQWLENAALPDEEVQRLRQQLFPSEP